MNNHFLWLNREAQALKKKKSEIVPGQPVSNQSPLASQVVIINLQIAVNKTRSACISSLFYFIYFFSEIPLLPKSYLMLLILS